MTAAKNIELVPAIEGAEDPIPIENPSDVTWPTGVVVSKGLEVIHGDRLYRIEEFLEDSVALRDVATNALINVEPGDYALPPSGELNWLRPIEKITAEEEARAKQIEKGLNPLLNLKGRPTRSDMAEAAAFIGLSPEQAGRYYRKLLKYRHWRSCVPKKPGPKLGAIYIHGKRLELLKSLVAQEVAKGEGVTGKSICTVVIDEFNKQGLKPPSINTILKFIKSTGVDLRIRKRLGAKVEKESRTASHGSLEVSRPLEFIEIDSTRADVIVVDQNRQPLCRPWVTFVIDVYSRVILGVYVALHAPSAISVGSAIVDALFPKNARMKQLGLTELKWPVYGKFERITGLDHGPEHENAAILNGLKILNIAEPRWRKRITHGAHIERLIGTMVGQMHLLPGTTHSNVKIRADYDSEKTAILTIEEFERWLIAQVVAYINTPHRKGQTPLQMWSRGWAQQTEKAPRLIENDREVKIAFLPFEMRTVTRAGIEMNSYLYRSPNLSALIAKKTRVPVHYYPNDLSRVWVHTPEGRFLEIPWDVKQPPISLFKSKLLRKIEAILSRDPIAAQDAARARAIGNEVVDSANKKTKSARKAAALEVERREKAEAYLLDLTRTKVDRPSVDWSAPVTTLRVRRG